MVCKVGKVMPNVGIAELVALAKAAAAEAADHQERFAAADIEARKIVDIMERFLRVKGRVVYGGAAINAHLSPEHKFYDPSLYLPDYDFMTPDPLQDCADLIVAFQQEGFEDVEAKFGIHEGTYKIFVNYRSAADITYMPSDIYDRVIADADTIDGIRYASVNFLRMNIYLELSRPAGMVSRWEKIYERLLLLNQEHPPTAGRCTKEPLAALATTASEAKKSDILLHDKIVQAGVENGAIFLSGISQLVDVEPASTGVVLLLADKVAELSQALKRIGLKATVHDAMGELLPARIEFHTAKKQLVAVVFEVVACHSYVTHGPLRLGSVDLLIQMYYAMYFADLQGYVPVRLMCIIQELIELEAETRRNAVASGKKPHEVFQMDCIGHQPTMPELKKAHRERVVAKREELSKALRLQNSPRFSVTRKRRRAANTQ